MLSVVSSGPVWKWESEGMRSGKGGVDRNVKEYLESEANAFAFPLRRCPVSCFLESLSSGNVPRRQGGVGGRKKSGMHARPAVSVCP